MKKFSFRSLSVVVLIPGAFLLSCSDGRNQGPRESMIVSEPPDLVENRDYSFERIVIQETGCDKGLESFKATLHPFLREKCKQCHESSAKDGQGPVHSNSDPIESYANIRRFINVDNPGASKLARYGGNGHCQDVYGDGRECGATTEAIRDKILAWYNEGEKDCRTERKFVTEEQLIPTDLPGRNKGFKKMRWSLDSVSPALTGAKLEIELQKFSDLQKDIPGSYRIRSPRIALTKTSVRIKGIKILINGKFDPTGVQLSLVDQTINARPMTDLELQGDVWPTPVLSVGHTIVLQDLKDGDRISVAFDDVISASAMECKVASLFGSNVAPVLNARGCYYCHGGGPDKFPGETLAVQRLSMALTDQELCTQALQRMNKREATLSPFITYGLSGSNGHQKLISSPVEVFPAWTQWLAAEIAAP